MLKNKGKVSRYIWPGLVSVFFLYLIYSFQAHDVYTTVTESTEAVQVDVAPAYTSFSPTRPKTNQQLIFFPGALVDPAAYYPLLRSIAEAGYVTILVKMPFRMATYGYKNVREVVDFADTTKRFILCGHSQGGKMAAQFAFENPGALAGLILLGTSHPRDIDLSKSTLPVLKVYASEDGLARVEEVEENKSKLPAHTSYLLLKGGNHSQFANYGHQLTDGTATISRKKQQAEIKSGILAFLAGMI